ncbi:MAG: hypothetical protein JW726_04380 [Anaerolineales bacterium]|nr:hypothetical protein [Anaerolineales bacterium]
MNKRKWIILIVPLLAILLLTGVSLAASGLAVDWSVIGGGGGQVASTDGLFTLDGTTGQPVVGPVDETSYELCSGFWCGLEKFFRTSLPFLTK